MQTDVFETIRFFALRHRRPSPIVPLHFAIGGAVVALMLVYAGTLHAADESKVVTGTAMKAEGDMATVSKTLASLDMRVDSGSVSTV